MVQYRLRELPVYVVGCFDVGITVFAQQLRALNLVWALEQSGELTVDKVDVERRVAVVGAGFAGLTVAGGLIRKGLAAKITLFERQDTILPLQRGSDSRWLHPHIYDWPQAGSESNSAALPVLNWTASRASDVVAQVSEAWSDLLEAPPSEAAKSASLVEVYCNTQHLQVRCEDGRPIIEWVGERRRPSEPSTPEADGASVGRSAEFDIVILAVGFGLERDTEVSYWRNENYAQPSLGQARTTYIVSGAGDGAFIDLFRLRISNFRQDRILAELFRGSDLLVAELRRLFEKRLDQALELFSELEQIWNRADDAGPARVLETLKNRLRRDTHVLLHLRGDPTFAVRLNSDRRISFQNRVLAYLLFKSGGFIPTSDGIDTLQRNHGVPDDRVINRHGTTVVESIKSVLSKPMHELLPPKDNPTGALRQEAEIRWPAGYFDTIDHADDARKGHWRKEYLPSPTQSIAAAFCASVAGHLQSLDSTASLRVTLHRTLMTGHETVLQQCCEYQPLRGSTQGAGRTFPAANATIGAAFQTHRVVRSKTAVGHEELDAEMQRLDLNQASREMAKDVVSVCAIPLLHDHRHDDGPSGSAPGSHPLAPTSAGTVVGVLYLDCNRTGYFTDDLIGGLVSMCQAFIATLADQQPTVAGRIANTAFWTGTLTAKPQVNPPAIDLKALEVVKGLEPPRAPRLGYLNYDLSDFTPIEEAHP